MPDQPASTRFKILSERDRRVGARIAHVRRVDKIPQKALAETLGLTLNQMANIESGRVSLRVKHGWRFCITHLISPVWLATGEGWQPLDYLSESDCALVNNFVEVNKDALFSELYQELDRMVTGVLIEKDLTHVTQKGNNSVVKSEITRLMQRISKASKVPGRRAELARWLGVSPPRISEWLSGKKEPGGETTLRLLHWVEQQERRK